MDPCPPIEYELTAVADTSIYSSPVLLNVSNSVSAGGSKFISVQGTNVWSGTTRALLLFDVSSLPTDGDLLSATIMVHALAQGSSAPITVHRLFESWEEGVAGSTVVDNLAGALQGYLPVTGDRFATFNFRAVRPPPQSNLPWALAGGTFVATSSSIIRTGSFPAISFLGTGLAKDVDDWRKGATPNRGWLFQTAAGVNNFIQFNSRSSANPPKLMVSIRPVCTTPGPDAVTRPL